MKELIEFSEFLEIEKKLDIRIGLIVEAERVAKSTKMLKLRVLFGPEEGTDGIIEKIVMTNIGNQIEPIDILNVKVPFIINLKPVTIMGVVSEAMIIPGVSPYEGKLEFERYTAGSKLI